MDLSKEDFIKIYGNTIMTFDSYYKYSFSFKGKTNDNINVFITTEGDKDGIYRFYVENKQTLNDLNKSGLDYDLRTET